MSNVGNKFKVGVIVIVSGVLLVLGLVSLGVMKYFYESYEFMTVIQTSVQGLSKGSLVKYKGVPIGQVTKIQISDIDDNVYVYMAFQPESFSRSDREEIKLRGGISYLDDELKKLVDNGMRCQLKYAGITGELYMEIAMFDPGKYPVTKFKLPEEHPPYLPSIPQLSFGDLMETLHKSLGNLTRIDFKAVSNKFEKFLDSANEVVGDHNIRKTFENLSGTMENLSDVSNTLKTAVTTEKIDNLIKSINTTSENLNKTFDDISKLTKSLDDEMKSAEIPSTVKELKKFMNDAKQTLERANELAVSLRDLSNYLEQNPNSVIMGRKDEPLVKP